MDRQKRVLAIHDISCVGRCSLTVALPILSCGGLDTGVLPTAILSTHTGGFHGYTYRDLTEDIQPVTAHWKSLGLCFDALYSGFLGSYDQIDLVARLMEEFHGENTLRMVDPVMADNGRLYATYTTEMAQGMHKLCRKADIITPNMTEACILLGIPYKQEGFSRMETEDMLLALSELGPRQVVFTGVTLGEDQLGTASYDAHTEEITYAFESRYPGIYHGTGDIFASTLLCCLLNGKSLAESARLAVKFTHRCIKHTVESKQELRYGVRFEAALPYLMELLGAKTEG
jgi:pyridoxine kinase